MSVSVKFDELFTRVNLILYFKRKFEKLKLIQFFQKRPKRRATRAVRPTKRTEFTEADGQVEGKIVFQLEKESQHETFKIRDENPWVTVEPNGAVRVKKRWDYEELGREKTIDFWVIITNSGAAGKNIARFIFSQFMYFLILGEGILV